MNDLIKFDIYRNVLGYFPALKDLSYLARYGGAKRKFHNYDKEIRKYERIISTLNTSYYRKNGNEYYQSHSSFDSEGRYSYEFIWDIERVNQIIEEHRLAVEKVPVQKLIGMVYLEKDELDLVTKDPKETSTGAILYTLYDPGNAWRVINGRHRTTRQYLKDPHQEVDAIKIPIHLHLQAFADPSFATMYKIHHNIIVMLNYMIGYIDHIEYSNQPDNKGLYKI